MRELEGRRTRFSKTFDLGGGRRRLDVGRIPCHFERDGKLHDIDLTPTFDVARDQYVIRNCPYSLRVSNKLAAYAYNSLSGKRVSVELAAEVGEAAVADGIHKWGDVGIDTDYLIQPLPHGCATVLILHTQRSPRRWSWRVIGDMDLLQPLWGQDADGKILELIERRDPELGLIEVEWTGRALSRAKLRQKKRAEWTDEIAYPCFIDPTVNENIAAGGDDASSAWAEGTSFYAFDAAFQYLLMGNTVTGGNYSYQAGFRFQTVSVPAGATINSATLTLRATTVTGTPNVIFYGNDVNDAGAWATPGNRIHNITKTTASTVVSSWSANADNAIDVATIVAEIVARAGWASNNDLAIAGFRNGGAGADNFVRVAAFEHATLTEARLSIDYTAAAATTAAASSSGAATVIAAGASRQGAAMSASGATTVSAVGSAIQAAAANATAAATAIAVGSSIIATSAAASAVGVSSASGGGAASIAAAAQSAGVGEALAEGAGGIVIVVPDFTPAGGGGAIPPSHDGKRFRIRKDKNQPHVIRVGEWPTEAQLQELKEAAIRAEQREFSQFISSLPMEEDYDNADDEEQALMLILSMAA